MTPNPERENLPAPLRWLGYLAWAFLVLIAVAVALVRAGVWQQGLLIYAVACLLSTVALLIFAITFLLPRFSQRRGAILTRALPAIPGLALLVAGILGSQGIPPIHDISTDLQDPPTFDAVRELRGDDSNPLDAGEKVRQLQRAAYPDISTLRVNDSVDSAFERSRDIAETLGWDVVAADEAAGRIEAVATTAIMGFRDDVVIRIRGDAGTTLIDLRSVSRVGQSDLGANAKRIRRFLAAYGDR